jgi:malate synthase
VTWTTVSRPKVRIARTPTSDRVLTREALGFIVRLHRQFEGRRRELLAQRGRRQFEIDAGAIPGFLDETAVVRDAEWMAAPAPPDLERRWVEIAGPAERKMMINALNSGADVFMADLEDSLSPTWTNIVEAHVNLQEAVGRTLAHRAENGQEYGLNDRIATLVVRPRGWHLSEKHVEIDGERVSASLLDFGLYMYHNVHELLARETGPYFYLPKLENHREARLWNDVFIFAQDALNLPEGTIRATVLIENVLAAFEMEEILYELRNHVTGLNAGRWDYIFSIIKKFRNDPNLALPDRRHVTMTTPFMRAYTERLVRACHRRGVHAIGGMAAFMPSRRDPEVNERALAAVLEDKRRESQDGFDGTWVAHPDLVPIAREAFHEVLGQRPHQKTRLREDVDPSPEPLLDVEVPECGVTRDGVRQNVRASLRYLAAWLSGLGAVAIHDLREDTATAELSRAQLWQWCQHGVELADGGTMTHQLYEEMRNAELELLRTDGAGDLPFARAAQLLDRLVLNPEFTPFLTLPGYRYLT